MSQGHFSICFHSLINSSRGILLKSSRIAFLDFMQKNQGNPERDFFFFSFLTATKDSDVFQTELKPFLHLLEKPGKLFTVNDARRSKLYFLSLILSSKKFQTFGDIYDKKSQKLKL